MADETPDLPDMMLLLLGTDSLEGFLQLLADGALALAADAVGTGITLERHGRPLTVVSSGVGALALDEAQYGQDDGPCLQSLRRGEEVLVEDLLHESRWGPYPAYAAASGTRASLSLPIAAHTHTAGALNLYSPKPFAFTGIDLTSLRKLAEQATGAIALAQRIADTREYTADLQHAMESRTAIDQAIGVIMGQQRCTAEAAFALLRKASQHRNVKLRDICQELLSNIGGAPPAGGRPLRPRP
ncbi:GAF and ANTAR domain-containing protein [Streptomyces apricus]|uniref:GAF and ANTAR domain-containing protein n=1 Tax=Streptomyces apricus TaxID=1828112 RepID=A0A5B0AIT2_9ACTN|nr:GAF and ANTAR domain-containing protein [Streptomyces apricus]KAA0929031.1 GAF and ANTAR domain-containing protein [Streptomyces apricus]